MFKKKHGIHGTLLMNLSAVPPAAISYYQIMNRSALLCVSLTFNYARIRFPSAVSR